MCIRDSHIPPAPSFPRSWHLSPKACLSLIPCISCFFPIHPQTALCILDVHLQRNCSSHMHMCCNCSIGNLLDRLQSSPSQSLIPHSFHRPVNNHLSIL